MRFLSASALWWLLLGASIIFFYLLKLKRKRRVVPSVFLWQRALEEIEANAPFKKLRRSLLLLLQLVALAAIVFGLARPLIQMRSLASGSTVIIIDSTASMSSRDEGTRSRLVRAKELARDMIAGLGGNDRAAVIESSSRVTVRSGLTADHAALNASINDIQETDAAGNLTDAVRLAEQIARTEREAGVVVISDNPFLLQAIAANDALDARKVSADAPLASFDCVITDGAIAANVIESGRPLLAINPTDVAGWWHANGARERPEITSVDRGHPVNSYLSYADVHIESMTRRDATA